MIPFIGLTMLVCGAAYACGPHPAPSLLDPRGPAAERISALWWLMVGSAGAVYVIVLAVFVVAVFRPRRGAPAARSGARGGDVFIGIGGAVTAVILLVLMTAVLLTLTAVSAPRAPVALSIEVVGRQWWWEVRYPDQQVVTANEIHIPVGQPVEVMVTSDDVIHSFWVPQLQGKIDAIPGRDTSIWLQADQPGVYRGECAEYCGVQHAHMAFVVVAEPPDQLAAWLERQRQPAAEPSEPLARQGLAAFLRSPCVVCHTVRGTPARGTNGPDLTHLASRRTIAAGTLANNRGNLGGWIVNAQAIKPGNKMPPVYLGVDDFQAILAYLESLN